MSDQPNQDLNISDSVLESVQIGGIAGRDLNLTQIQGNIASINVFGTVNVPLASLSAAKELSKQEYKWRKIFLSKVKQFWIDGVLKKSLHNQVLIELGLEERDEYIQRPTEGFEEFPSESRQVLPHGTSATDIFDDMDAGRTLLILGEPGSGKTVILLKIAESLIKRSENDLSQPLPVVTNLSSWSKNRLPMAEWLVQELYEIYGVSKSLGKIWVGQEHLILLLDGLDEVDSQYRNGCVKTLNQFIQTHSLTEIVVCSRIRDYEILSERLKLRSAIYVQPLTSEQIYQFLMRAGESLSALKTLLQHNGECRTFASSPLILSIMSLTYEGYSTDVPAQAEPSKAQRQYLLDNYIDRMLTRRGTTRHYSREQTMHWLIWLSQRMVEHSQTVFLIERLQPSWLSSGFQRVIYRTGNSLVLWIPFGLISGVYIGLLGRLFYNFQSWTSSVAIGIAIGLLLGIVFGTLSGIISELIFGLFFRNVDDIKTVETLKWSLMEAKKSFLITWPIGVSLGLIWGFIYNPGSFLIHPENFELGTSLINGLIHGLIFGIVGGLTGFTIGGLRGPTIQEYSIPNQGIWKSAKNSLVLGMIGGMTFGLFFLFPLLAFEIINDSASVSIHHLFAEILFFFLFYGLPGFLIGWLIGGGLASLRHFVLRTMLYHQGNIPWNYARFLNYATDRLVLQKVGGGYIFVHRMLLEHFAAMPLDTSKPKRLSD
jgi:hypothetical protein